MLCRASHIYRFTWSLDDQPAILIYFLPGLIIAAAVAGVIRERQLIVKTGVDHVEIPAPVPDPHPTTTEH